ncbi:MAG: T9SS type A sorting domain-containing protein, partial [Saprospiraceae bacterium]|nr:T9SS type A sorting domain-containing protein [Saprospiraceae bacterium]
AWVWDDPNHPELDQVVFTRHQVSNRGQARLDSVRLGVFVDFAIGCENDDLLGCQPASNTFFAYNQDDEDGNQDFSCDFGSNWMLSGHPPVQAVTFLDASLDGFTTYGFFNPGWNAGSEVTNYHHAMHTRWPTGEPIRYGGNGYDSTGPVTQWMFPGNPNQPGEWVMDAKDSINFLAHGIGMHDVGTLEPGEGTSLLAAWSYYRAAGNTNLENVNLMYTGVTELRRLYQSGFSGIGLVQETIGTQVADADAGFVLSPNPADEWTSVSFATPVRGRVQVFAASGALVFSQAIEDARGLTLPLGALPRGVYTVLFSSAAGLETRQLVLL